jgi:hypothetical protein
MSVSDVLSLLKQRCPWFSPYWSQHSTWAQLKNEEMMQKIGEVVRKNVENSGIIILKQ